jgi:hypothetical protein
MHRDKNCKQLTIQSCNILFRYPVKKCQWVIQKTTRAVRAAACPLASQFLLERTEEVRCVPQVKEKFGRQQLRAGDGLWW